MHYDKGTGKGYAAGNRESPLNMKEWNLQMTCFSRLF